MEKQERGGVLAGLVLFVAGGCSGSPSPTHLGTDVMSGTNTKYASVSVGTDGTTYFGDSFSGPLDIDPLGTGTCAWRRTAA
jgi:hypothetical protein